MRFLTQVQIDALDEICTIIHENNVEAGWWSDLKFDDKIKSVMAEAGCDEEKAIAILKSVGVERSILKTRNMGELLCLTHSELSEGMEGHRKNLQDDKLPHHSMLSVELADAFIREFDICGSRKIKVGTIINEKMMYNANRADHKIENRMSDNGKKY